MFSWNWEPSLLIGLALQAGAYLVCVGPLRRLFPGSAPVPTTQIQIFLLGTLTLFIALVSPLDALGDDYLLSAHMVQHLLLALAAPPLLLLGTPRWLLRPAVSFQLGRSIGRLVTHPLFAFMSFNIIFALWHVPRYYEAALQDQTIHIIEHITFFGAATLTWWPVFSPLDELPALPQGGQVLYLFFQSLPASILGAVITFADTPLYPTYASAPRVWADLSVMSDQQLGGLLMWIPGGLVFFVVLTIIFFRWFNDEEYEPAGEGVAG